jgi:hypothetical protein
VGENLPVRPPVPVDFSLANVSFKEIVETYDNLEDRAQTAAFHAFADSLSDQQYTGAQVAIGEVPHFLQCETSAGGRQMAIKVRPIVPTRSEKIELSEELYEAGLIRRISVFCHRRTAAKAQRALTAALLVLRTNYRLLERRFLEQYREHHKELFAGIEPMIFAAFDQSHLPQIASQCRLSVTQLGPSKYSLYLGPEQARAVVDQLKAQRVEEGVLELVITLIVGEGLDGFMARNALRQDQFVSFTFAELGTTNTNPDLVNAESLLSASRSLACLELCRTKNLSLQANLSARYAAQAQGPLLAIRPQLTERFQENIKRAGWRRYQLGLSWSARRVRRKAIWKKVYHDLLVTAGEVIMDRLTKFSP